jgi:hypothetical protein
MASQIELCNEALIRLGAPTITDIDDNTKAAKLCKKLYDRVIEQVSAEGPFSNTIKRVALATLTTDPTFGYNVAYQLPNDCIKVITVNDQCPGDKDFRVEDNKLYSNDTSISIQYISRLSSTGNFGVYMSNSVVDLLAAKMAYAFTGSMTIARELMQVYRAELQSNLAGDNQQGSRDVVQVRDFLDVR